MRDKTIDFIFKVLKPYYKKILLLLFVNLSSILFINIQPYISKIIINSFLDSGRDSVSNIAFLIFVLVTNLILIIVTRIIFDKILLVDLLPVIKLDSTLNLVKKLFKHSYDFYSNNFSGSLLARVNDISEGIYNILPIVFERFIGSFLMMLTSCFIVNSVGFKYSIVILTWSIVFVVISYKLSSKSRYLAGVAAYDRSISTGLLTDVITNILNVRYFANQEGEFLNLKDSFETSASAESQRSYYNIRINLIKALMYIILTIVCLSMLLFDYRNYIVTVGDFSLILSTNFLLIEYFSTLSKNFYRFTELYANIVQGVKTIFSKESIVEKVNTSFSTVISSKVAFKNVFFRYQNFQNLFQGLNVVIEEGSKIGIVGKSGAGKSTLVNLLLRNLDPDSGCIEIGGSNIKDFKIKSLNQAIGYVPQDVVLFHRSIYDNIKYGKLDATESEVFEAAKQANIHEFIVSLRDGYKTTTGDRGVKPSGGQRQRIAIARCILKNAPILILDEATSNLDLILEKEIQTSLDKLMINKTVIVITHRISTIVNLDRIIVLDNGKIIEDGKHQDLIKRKGFYSKLWQKQMNGFI